MHLNPVKFAVVREDPRVEDALVRRTSAKRVLLIASGGCTALSLRALHPGIDLTLLDPNPAQLERVRRKLEALDAPAERRAELFGIGRESREGLNGDGAFESLFRSFRRFLEEFVLPAQGWRALLAGPADPHAAALERVFSHPYWPVAFELFFSDPLLNTMFTEAATQHAPRGSYPAYFRRALERALASRGARDNYFLHHVFLGHYLDRPEALPPYLAMPTRGGELRFVEGALDAIESLARFDLVHLSNIFDWMDRGGVERVARRIGRELRPGAAVVYRQLNNTQDFRPLFGDGVRFDDSLGAELLGLERAAFYMTVTAGFAGGGK